MRLSQTNPSMSHLGPCLAARVLDLAKTATRWWNSSARWSSILDLLLRGWISEMGAPLRHIWAQHLEIREV